VFGQLMRYAEQVYGFTVTFTPREQYD
jgi:hypothetical protein